MKLNQHKNHKKRNVIAISAIAVVVVVASVGVWAMFGKNKPEDRPENSVDYNPPTSEQQKAGEKAKEEFINRDDDSKKTDTAGGNDTPSADTVSITFSSLNQNDQTYQLRTVISALDADGNCHLTLTKSGSTTVEQDAGTQILGSYSVCKGFDIPVSSLEKGSWQAKVVYKGSAGQGSVQQAIEVR